MAQSKKYYPDVEANPDFAKIEERVLASWQKDKTFLTSVENHPAQKNGKNNEFIFYDGPPFANGLPHYGHLLTGFVKDLFARYQTMKGKRVERRFGWDCHGLPAEMGAEKELGISGRQAIIKYGIGKFNDYCQTSVMKYTHEWEAYVTRQARWVDFKNDYKTMDKNYMESVIWAFKQLYDKGLAYEAYRVMPYSWAAETPLSNFETKLDNSYREREDKAITVAFELNTTPHNAPKAKKYYVLAWTTTPWTLPSNLALAVNEKIKYAYCVKDGEPDKIYILSSNAVSKYENIGLYPYKILREESGNYKAEEQGSVLGAELVGLSYHPLFPYFIDRMKGRVSSAVIGSTPIGGSKNAFTILNGTNFVTDADGTGIVHMAPGFGEDDQKCCEKYGIDIVVPVDGAGRYTDEIFDLTNTNYPKLPLLSLRGLNVIAETEGVNPDEPFKPEQIKKYGLVNLRIIRWLKMNDNLIDQGEIKHSYPHCWRTDKPLIYRAMPSWYVEVTKFRERAVELNAQINWIPEHIRDGQMGHMLATAPDWSISRNRFWGTPIPIWRSKSGKLKVFGSIAEIEKASGQKVQNLHRPYIDEIIVKEGGEEYKRVEDVFDCWFESGAMPFAQVHYPFENKEWFEHHFPADFITEYVGQTRGWFNTLIMLATALFDKPPFKNCICHGVVLDSETGLKYSKRLKNYKDPTEVMDKFGADALRWLMIASPVMRGLDISVDPEGKFIRDVVRLAIKPIWNAYNFFCLYANADGVKAEFNADSKDIMDRYILAKCKHAVEAVEKALDAYDTPTATEAVSQFFEALNNWYIRRSKERFWKEKVDEDKQSAYNTLYTVLHVMCRAAAPLLPLTLEEIYKSLTGEKSVHLTEYPDVNEFPNDERLLTQMERVRDICNAALSIRSKQRVRTRQPLNRIDIAGYKLEELDNYTKIIEEELNVKSVEIHPADVMDKYGNFILKLNFPVLGKRLKSEGKENEMKIMTDCAKSNRWKKPEEAKTNKNSLVRRILFDGKNEYPLYDGEYISQFEAKKDFRDNTAELGTGDAVVILDLLITPELEAEGYARDMVRLIQEARKKAGLNVADRINLKLHVSDKLAPALTSHKNYIAEQVLATSVALGDTLGSAFTAQETIENEKVSIGITAVAA